MRGGGFAVEEGARGFDDDGLRLVQGRTEAREVDGRRGQPGGAGCLRQSAVKRGRFHNSETFNFRAWLVPVIIRTVDPGRKFGDFLFFFTSPRFSDRGMVCIWTITA